MKHRYTFFLFWMFYIGLFGIETFSDSLDYNSLENNFSILNKYEYHFKTEYKIGIGYTFPISSHYLVEVKPIRVSWINKDKYNKDRDNYSIFFAIDFANSYIFSKIFPDINYFLQPFYFTNSYHNFFLNGNPDFYKVQPKSIPNLAIFLKNDTEYYVFKKNKWLEIAPGAGIKLCFYNFGAELGYEKKKINFIEHLSNYSGTLR